jgi:hypothetical protein
MTCLKFKIPNSKSQINSKHQVTKTPKNLPSPGGRGWKGGGKAYGHPHPQPSPVKGEGGVFYFLVSKMM